jgi:predicted RNase H-like nuclease (RuvC/YqgF family)
MNNKERVKFWKDKKIIAIDPGKNGGIAIYSIDNNCLIEIS